MMMMMMMMMNCFCGVLDRRKAFSPISSRDHCQDLNLRRTLVQALLNEDVQ